MRNEATQPDSSAVRYYADVCYAGQAYSIEVPLLPDADDPCGLLFEEFLQAHARIYGYSTRTPARIVNLRAVHQAGGQDSIDTTAYQCTGEPPLRGQRRSEEHTSELQSLMRISYAVFCLKKKTHTNSQTYIVTHKTSIEKQ